MKTITHMSMLCPFTCLLIRKNTLSVTFEALAFIKYKLNRSYRVRVNVPSADIVDINVRLDVAVVKAGAGLYWIKH